MPTIKLQVRRDTAANWSSSNPILLAGELGFETDTGKLKIGRTTSQSWSAIPYITSSISSITDIPGLTGELNLKATKSELNALSAIVNSKIDASQITAIQTHLEETIQDAIADLQSQINNSGSSQEENMFAMIIALGD